MGASLGIGLAVAIPGTQRITPMEAAVLTVPNVGCVCFHKVMFSRSDFTILRPLFLELSKKHCQEIADISLHLGVRQFSQGMPRHTVKPGRLLTADLGGCEVSAWLSVLALGSVSRAAWRKGDPT